MPLQLPPDVRPVLTPLFDVLPFEQAMPALVIEPGSHAPPPQAAAVVRELADRNPFVGRPDLLAGLWLYIDDLDTAHAHAQDDATPTGSFWHAVVHRREGDFDNARYWYAKASHHPAMPHIDLVGGGAGSGTDVAAYDPEAFVAQVQHAHEANATEANTPALMSTQRKEWKALFEWCAGRRA
ncbi:MAG: hypothetical protein AAF328_05110 [Planctomycetota bacterium]